MSDEGFEKEFVNQAFEQNWIAPLGPNVNEFELEFAKKVGSNYAAALSSGTAAIHLALKALGVDKDDIVICQSLTFSATANPILYQYAKPVFVDSDYETWNMNPKYLEEALVKYPNAKAVIVVHLYGLSAELDSILSICNKFNVPLIEDAAESLGTTYKGRQTGTFGKIGIFSFNGNKIITTSGGGMLVSDDINIVEKVRFWATQSRDKAKHYQHSEIGYNYRMSNIVAGIGRGQLKVLDQRVLKKKEIYHFYHKELSNIDGIEFMPYNSWNEPNFWLTTILLRDHMKVEQVINRLEEDNIESRPLWKPMHMQPIFESFDFIGSGIGNVLFDRGLCLPSDTKITDLELQRVVSIVRNEVLKNDL